MYRGSPLYMLVTYSICVTVNQYNTSNFIKNDTHEMNHVVIYLYNWNIFISRVRRELRWNFTAVLLCKVKRQYLFTCKVSRFRLLALHGSVSE